MVQTQNREDRFIARLERLRDQDDRGALAALRRGLSDDPGYSLETWKYVAPFTEGLPSARAESYCLIASLFALHPDSNWSESYLSEKQFPPNLGESFKILNTKSSMGVGSPANQDNSEAISSTERRFIALINSHSDDLHQHLKQAARLLRSNECPVHWSQLIRDINYWDSTDRVVQRRWARRFWEQ